MLLICVLLNKALLVTTPIVKGSPISALSSNGAFAPFVLFNMTLLIHTKELCSRA